MGHDKSLKAVYNKRFDNIYQNKINQPQMTKRYMYGSYRYKIVMIQVVT